MPKQRKIQPGDSTTSVAFEEGFFPETVWNDPANAAFRAERENMNVLVPGDVLTVPDKQKKTVRKPTDQTHRFKRRGVPERLILRMLDEGQPIVGAPYELRMGERVYSGVTDAEGKIEHFMVPNLKKATFVFQGGPPQTLWIGRLEPVDTEEGLSSRLENLGYLSSEDTSAAAVQAGLKSFQRDNGLPETGENDAATQAKLIEQYGC